MVSITFPLENKWFSLIEGFPWVNWSEVTREELLKKKIFNSFMKTGDLSDKDQKFCDEIDWYPVDELPLREDFIKKIKKLEKGPHSRMTMEELDKLMELE